MYGNFNVGGTSRRVKRTAKVVAAAAIGSVFLAACGSASSTSSSGGSATTSAANCPKQVKVGVLAPLTGFGAAFGVPQANGAVMVADAINAAGGIKELCGAKIDPIVVDTQSSATVAAQELRQLKSEGVSAFVGPVLSTSVVANKPLIESLGIPDFNGAGDLSTTQNNVNGWIFRTSSITANSGTETLDFVKYLQSQGKLNGLKRVALLDTTVPPGSSLQPVLEAGLQQLGIQVTNITYDPTQTNNWPSMIAKMASANVQLIMGFQEPPDAIQLAQAMSAQSWRPQFGLFSTAGGEFLQSFRKAAGSVADGWAVTAFASNLNDTNIYTPQTAALAAQFEAKYGQTMEGSSATVGTTNMAIVADAIGLAKSTDPAKIAAAARKLDFSNPKQSEYPYYMTPGGVKFDANQNNTKLVTPIIQWNNSGGFNTIYPQDIANASVLPPL